MNRIIKDLSKITMLKKPSNLAPRYKYNELPDPNIQAIINNKQKNFQIPSVINGKEYFQESLHPIHHKHPMNHNYYTESYPLYQLDKKIDMDIMEKARLHWNDIGQERRVEIFETIADQIQCNVNGYKDNLLTDTMIGLGKSLYEAEIDSVCELVDFLKFNNYYAMEIMSRDLISNGNEFNFSEINGLNGFVGAITPFNFTAIGANLVSAPLLMGSPVIWKPSESALLSNYTFYKILLENNVPPELVSFVVTKPEYFLDYITSQPNMAGIVFTGSCSVFDKITSRVGQQIEKGVFDNYPRLVGETGGKNFHFVDSNVDIEHVAEETYHAAFGYNGQKCSACSRVYLPEHHLDAFINKISKLINENCELEYASRSLINEKSFMKTKANMQKLHFANYTSSLIGGLRLVDAQTNSVYPYIYKTNNPNSDTFNKEYFAPILGICTYDSYSEEEREKILDTCMKHGGKYALAGAVFSNNDKFLADFYKKFRFQAGNFYINTRCTGAIVGQQPFGGLGKSGTNDKAGDINFLYRLINQRSIKCNLDYS